MLVPFIVILFVGLSACSFLPPDKHLQRLKGELAPLYGLETEDRIPDEYNVVFRDNHTHGRHFETIGRDFSMSEAYIKYEFGYTMNLSDTNLCNDVRRDPDVLLVETNQRPYMIDSVYSSPYESDYVESEHDNVKRYTQNTATNAPYGLQMVAASGKLPTPVNDHGNYDYVDRAGQGVNVYVLDSGIRITHNSFQGRARNFQGLKSTDKSPYCADTMDDVDGHGTHIAGIIGARTYGVAPSANLINVKIANNNRKISSMMQLQQAIRDVTKEHNENKAKDPDYKHDPFQFRGSIINLSLGWKGEPFGIFYELKDANEAGIKIYAAAGNSNIDASNTYPCANIQTSCIAAVDDSYNKAWFSNYGGSIDYIAPGDNILSLGIRSDSDLAIKSGTSMAVGYASGAAAIFTFWQGLVNDQSHHYADYVWWNSIKDLTKGFSSTSNLFINTGIHSKKKYNNEPFRWAGDWPVKNHEANDKSVTATPALTQELTTFATKFSQSTVTPLKGLTTQAVVDPSSLFGLSLSPFDTASALSALSTVTFSFDPTTSAVKPKTT